MPNPFFFRAAMYRLSRLAGPQNPPHVRLAATARLARVLMADTPRARLAQQLLQQANPFEFARHKLRDLYDRADSLCPEPSGAVGAPRFEEEEPLDESEDPL